MRPEKWAEILQANSALEEQANSLLVDLNGLQDGDEKSFDISASIVSKDDSTSGTVARIFSVTGIVTKLKSDEHTDLIPVTMLQQLLTAINGATGKVQGLTAHLRSSFAVSNPLVSFEYSNFHGMTKNGQNINCAPQFQQFYDSVETLLATYLSIAPVVSKSSGNFQSAARAFARLVEKLANDRDEVRKTLAGLKKISSDAERFKTTADAAAAEVNRLKENSTSEQQTIGEYLAEATQRREKIDVVHTAAVELSSKVSEYDESFQSFQRQLDDRNERFVDGTAKLDKLIANFDKQEKSFDGLIKKSEDMLKSSTVAGLAAHFDTIRGSLTTELDKARNSFYVGIGLLVVSAIPLLTLVLMPVLEFFNPDLAAIRSQQPDTGTYYLGQVIARIIILLPAAWFVRFASKRHTTLFKLREDYAYKYSMAVSVDGFKKQAPDYESEIAAVVFEQLAFNPADKMANAKKEDESPSKLMDMFQNMVAKAMDKINGD